MLVLKIGGLLKLTPLCRIIRQGRHVMILYIWNFCFYYSVNVECVSRIKHMGNTIVSVCCCGMFGINTLWSTFRKVFGDHIFLVWKDYSPRLKHYRRDMLSNRNKFVHDRNMFIRRLTQESVYTVNPIVNNKIP